MSESAELPAPSDQLNILPQTGCCSTRASRYACFFTIVLLGCSADLITKSAIFNWLGQPQGGRGIYWLVEGFVGIETALNEGAVFGAMAGFIWLFCVMSILAIAGILFWLFAKQAIDDLFLTITLAVITGGILGNLYDRVMFSAVRDWIRLSYYDRVWPNFNIADSLLVVGAILLVWHSYQLELKAKQITSGQKATS